MQLDSDHVAWLPTSLNLCAAGRGADAAPGLREAAEVRADSSCEISCEEDISFEEVDDEERGSASPTTGSAIMMVRVTDYTQSVL